MGAVATFNYELWFARYPAFSNVSQVQAQLCWNEATIYHRNDGGGPVQDPAMQAALLNMLTAHIAFLSYGTADSPASASQGLVGRISSASQGSVSVSVDLQGVASSAYSANLTQTRYGLDYLAATAPYRLMHYRPGRGRRVPW
jgi:hypothetical protein